MRRFASLASICWLASLLGVLLTGCASAATTPPAGAASSGACSPNDQDKYVYQPTRLRVLQACMHVSGIVDEVERDGVDGDITLLVRLDAPYEHLLTATNHTDRRGNLVVEPVCMLQPLQPGAIALCAADPSPYAGPIPPVGTHIWLEGRYVLDLNHGGWAELHPLYRAGILAS